VFIPPSYLQQSVVLPSLPSPDILDIKKKTYEEACDAIVKEADQKQRCRVG